MVGTPEEGKQWGTYIKKNSIPVCSPFQQRVGTQNTHRGKEGGVPIPICWDGGRWIGWAVAGSDERLEG